jgi:hypothetical protein
MMQCLNRLNGKETDPGSIYDQWISYEKRDDMPNSIKQWKGINLKDYQKYKLVIFFLFYTIWYVSDKLFSKWSCISSISEVVLS